MITIDKQYLQYNSYEFAIYTSLRMTYNNDICKNCITDIDTIVYNLFGYFDNKYKYKREFSSTMKDMIEDNKIKCLKKQGYKYVLDISNYDITDKSEHISVDINKLRAIFNLNSRYSTPLELWQYYCAVMCNDHEAIKNMNGLCNNTLYHKNFITKQQRDEFYN